jgi:membrane protein insertase Oxa1/YidC/SpoIIIJ
MTLLMTGWMFVFMGIYYQAFGVFLFGLSLTIFIFWCIRTQFMITQEQYLLGMIPHHSMAIHMSEKLLEKKNNMREFLQNVITKQNEEITYMKYKLLF